MLRPESIGHHRSMDNSASLTRVNFHCRPCRYGFESEPARVEDMPQREWHPWAYFAPCPICAAEAPQAAWEVGLLAAAGKQTGPRTAAGIAAVTANLAGHPTPEEAKRTRFNALKHGLFAEVATYWPARPGAYAHCEGCEHFNICHEQPACLKRTELFMRHHLAFETGDPRMLTDLRASLQAKIQAVIDDIILDITRRGVVIEAPQWYYDKDGDFHLAEFTDDNGQRQLLKEINAHPLLKILKELIAANSLSLSDMGMTPKVQEDADILRGHLTEEKTSTETLITYQRQQTQLLEQLSGQIARSRERIGRDPVLIEHQEANADG